MLKSVSDADRARITELETSENSLKIENSRLKEVADVALTQASSMEQQKVGQEKELLSLRQQLIDIQCQSDEKKVIGLCFFPNGKTCAIEHCLCDVDDSGFKCIR